MDYKRTGGILLHPTSFPGPDGIGDLGPEAYRWIDFLAESGCGIWQVLPLNPTGYGNSPYQSFSAFAGNPYLVSPAMLREEHLLTRSDLADRPNFPGDQVDYGPVINWKLILLDRAFQHFNENPSHDLREEFETFKQNNAYWLEDYALFMAIKESNGGVSWLDWPEPLRRREPDIIQAFRADHTEAIESHRFRQFLFFRQWLALREYANERDILIIGDIPIFVSMDSSDTWSNPGLFYLKPDLTPDFVAGVPPDYFSPTGQLWGNPLYRWNVHEQTGYQWWIERIAATLKTVDIIRLDHFRGLSGYWEIPAGMPTAEIGRWVYGPGASVLTAVRNGLGDLPIIAEDLGVITQDVVDLREQFGLPGMKIFQFAFADGPTDPFLPHNYPHNCVAYTGTHDNDTAWGWYNTAPEKEKDFFRRYTSTAGDNVAWTMIREIWESVAMFSVAPMQDFLSLGSEARMNFPGKASGNWCWRIPANALTHELAGSIRNFNWLYARQPDIVPPEREKVKYEKP